MPKTSITLTPTMTETPRQRFSQLMREHHLELITFARAVVKDHEAARDIVQESLVTAWKKFDQFEEDKDFAKWVRGIVRNKSKDWFRKMQRTPIPDLDLVEMEIDLTTWQSAKAAGTGVFEAVAVCLEKLPENLREAVDTFYYENRDGNDAAKQLDISPANLRKRLERARGQLHECLSLRLNRADYTTNS